MRRRIFLIIGIALLFVVSVPTAAIYYFAYTESGLQWLVAHLPRHIADTDMEFVGAQRHAGRGLHRWSDSSSTMSACICASRATRAM